MLLFLFHLKNFARVIFRNTENAANMSVTVLFCIIATCNFCALLTFPTVDTSTSRFSNNSNLARKGRQEKDVEQLVRKEQNKGEGNNTKIKRMSKSHQAGAREEIRECGEEGSSKQRNNFKTKHGERRRA